MDPRWDLILALVRDEGRVNRQRVVEQLRVPERTAGRLLAAMAERSLLVVRGGGRSLGYTRSASADSLA